MPLAAMGELSNLNDLVNELARLLWRRKKNKQRLRPADYPIAPTLRITRFAKGSSIPLIERDGASSVALEDPYDASRDLVERTVWSIIDNAEIPAEFPTECLPSLRRIGRHLHSGEGQEFIEFSDNGLLNSRILTQEIRSKFWTAFDTVTLEDRTIFGQIESLARPHSFTFKQRNGQKLEGKNALWDEMHSALGKTDKHPYCRLYVTAEIDYVGRIRRVSSVERVEVFEMDPQHWADRFLDLASYAENWVPGAAPIGTTVLERADLLIRVALKSELPVPVIFGTFEGGVSLVWDTPTGRVTVYVEEDQKYEVERVPGHQVVPYATSDASVAISKVVELVDE
ncbi:hypothetical protein CVS28_12630 [Arthrobacter glacialis]|nr:hypothetical protein CVS28_12630 [Arthrobacter glacialis]